MKRICCLLCSVLMVFTLCCSPAFALRFSMDETAIMETAESYLSERMEAIYLRTGAQVSATTARTLLDIAGEWSLKLTGTTSSRASMTWYGTIRGV